jgi:hypothetical protein
VGKKKFPLVHRLAANDSAEVMGPVMTGLHPFQSAFLPDPDVADDQNQQKHQHFH